MASVDAGRLVDLLKMMVPQMDGIDAGDQRQ
jgi:hypothetical protein